MKKRKKLIIFLLIGLTILVTFLSIQLINLSRYKIEKDDNYISIIKGLKKTDNLTIKNKESEDYLVINDIKIRNDFKNFTPKEDIKIPTDTKIYVLKDENNETKAVISIGTEETYTTFFTQEATIYNKEDKYYNKIDRKKILKENNINNDLDFFKYLREHKLDNTIITPVKEMQKNYSMYLFTSIVIPKINYLTIIDGDYSGYIFNSNDNKSVVILKNNKSYIFTFLGLDYFTDDYLKDLLNTIVID